MSGVQFLEGQFGYFAIIGLMMIGLYIVFSEENFVKRLIGLSIFQTTICLFYVLLGKVDGGTAPVLLKEDMPKLDKPGAGAEGLAGSVPDAAHRVADLVHAYTNPLPHVLMLTAIVVGFATLSMGLALIVRIREAYGTVEADEVRELDMTAALAEEVEAARPVSEATA